MGLAFVLWGAIAFGAAHVLIDVGIMVGINEFEWDRPPGTGWITVAVLTIAGSVSLWFGGRRHEVPAVGRLLAPSA